VIAGELREFAPAKVNLTLRVGRPRADGYHPLDSLVVFADWGDEIRVRPSPAFLLSMSGEPSRGLSAGGDNLVLRAAMALQKAAGIADCAAIHLTKRIPLEAGLGGGSADAAATLRALNRLWGLDWPLDRLAQLGLDLGADVPACVYSAPLRMRGIGEWIELIDGVPELCAVIANPGVGVPTGPVFRAFDEQNPAPLPQGGWWQGDLVDWLAGQPNDLEAVAIQREPIIADTLAWLDAQPGALLSRMTGSGASCFALFDDHRSAREAADLFPQFAQAVILGGPMTDPV
jgi:4-diphosphocytidyl-2-C-methyl-D-erythritol kinase